MDSLSERRRIVSKDTAADRDTLNLHGYCPQMLGALVAFALDQLQAQPLKVAR
jgi:hypothetical protein